jgi:ribosomal protein S18 acetylase RimI-like enzyme
LSAAVRITLAGPEAADEVHRLTQRAFGGYTWLTPPSGAIDETEDDVRRDLQQHGGALGRIDGTAVAALRFVAEPRHLRVRRVAVDPDRQRKGIGHDLMRWIERHAAERGFAEVRLGVRAQLPGNRRFYEALGYEVIREHRYPGTSEVHWLEMGRKVGDAGRGDG